MCTSAAWPQNTEFKAPSLYHKVIKQWYILKLNVRAVGFIFRSHKEDAVCIGWFAPGGTPSHRAVRVYTQQQARRRPSLRSDTMAAHHDHWPIGIPRAENSVVQRLTHPIIMCNAKPTCLVHEFHKGQNCTQIASMFGYLNKRYQLSALFYKETKSALY